MQNMKETVSLNKYIDHTLLKADGTTAQVEQICQEALTYDFASVCVNTCHVPLVSTLLKGSDVKTCCVVGFPLGAMCTEAKAMEATIAVKDGAQEVDMVINVGALKENNDSFVEADIRAVVKASAPAIVKVIIETCLLTDDEIVRVCRLSQSAGAHFVKTSTGFSTGGATPEHVALMRQTVGDSMGVKASGGIRDFAKAQKLIDAGASRLGASAGIQIIKESLEQA